MSARPALPPPPPPVEIRTWPDRGALLADRAHILGALVKMHIGPGRLGLLWMWGAVGALGWALAGTAFVTFEESYDVFSAFFGVIFLGLGACCLVPAVVLVVIGLRRDRQLRLLLAQWGGLDRDPASDAAYRLPGVSLAWLLGSFVLCACGLYACFAVPAGAVRGDDTYGLMALVMGLGFIAWIIGLIGITKAFWHRRWILRTLLGTPVPAPLVSVERGTHR